GLSLTEVAIIDAPFWLIVLAAEVPTGAVADRWGRSTSLVLGALVYAAALVAFGLAPTLPLIMVSYFIWAVALTFTSGADSALLYDTLKRLGREHEYEKYAGRGMAMRSSAILLATIVGGPIAAATSLATPMFISAGILLAAAMVGLALKEPPRLEAGGAQLSYVDGVRAAARTVWRTPALRYLLPFSAVLLAATMATEYLTQPFLLAHGVNVGWTFSALQVPLRLMGVVGALAAFWFVARNGEVRTLIMLPCLGIAAYAGLALWDELGALGFLAVVGLLRSAAFPIITGYINRRVPSDQRATVLSFNQMGFSLLLAPLVPALGISADKIDLPTGFAVAAATLAALALVTGALWLRAHRRSTEPEAAAAPVIAPLLEGGAALRTSWDSGSAEAAAEDAGPHE
ncbi:MAG: MFS transporter, partial [Dehalococcoidia bacterium]